MELDSNLPSRLLLKGKPGQKAVLLEYADGNTEEDNIKGVQQWEAALKFLIKHASS